MKTIELNNPSWRSIRLALSLSLMKREPVLVKNGFLFINENFDSQPLYDGVKKLIFDTGAGMLVESGDDISFNPDGLSDGKYSIESGNYCPVTELELFLLPSLFYSGFRSVINYRGVTHGHVSYPTTFLKETLFGFLEKTGHYASMNLKRFGFYGSGGGMAESRVYPAEPKKYDDPFVTGEVSVEGVKIFIAKMNMEMAGREKEFMIRSARVDERRVQIMEVVDADGYGNSIQVYVKCCGVNVILSRDMEFYNSAGDFVFDEAKYYLTLASLIDENEALLKMNRMPVCLTDEVLPYLVLSGSVVPEELKGSDAYMICSALL